jgi:hypothetical protein
VASTKDRDGNAVDLTARAEVFDGDDVVVIPDEPQPHNTRRRQVTLVVGALATVIAIIIIVAAIAAGGNKTKPQVLAASPNPNLGRTAPKPSASASKPDRGKTRSSTPRAPLTSAPVIVVPPSLPKSTTPPTAPPALTQYPPSSIRWTAPASLTIAHNAQTTITVVALNPTNGTITLPHPLACAPTLSGNGACVEMAQILAPGETASARYKIDGAEVSPGIYTLVVEGVLKIKVVVTA